MLSEGKGQEKFGFRLLTAAEAQYLAAIFTKVHMKRPHTSRSGIFTFYLCRCQFVRIIGMCYIENKVHPFFVLLIGVHDKVCMSVVGEDQCKIRNQFRTQLKLKCCLIQLLHSINCSSLIITKVLCNVPDLFAIIINSLAFKILYHSNSETINSVPWYVQILQTPHWPITLKNYLYNTLDLFPLINIKRLHWSTTLGVFNYTL